MTYQIVRGVTTVVLSNGTTRAIQKESMRKLATLIPIPMPLNDSNETEVFDYLGVVREITVEGSSVDTQANTATFLNSLLNFINGAQSDTGNFSYTSDLMGTTYSVKIDSFDWDYDAGTALTNARVSWSLKLIESANV